MDKKRRPYWILLSGLFSFFVLFFPACSEQYRQNINTKRKDPIQLDRELNCYNTYLEVSLTIPKGWKLYDLNTANFSPDPADTVDSSTFDVIYDENLKYLSMISFTNNQAQNKEKHLKFDIHALLPDNLPFLRENIENFKGIFPDFALDERISFIDSGNVIINSNTFRKHLYQPQTRGNSAILALSTRLKSGYFLIIIVTYWQRNQTAEFDIHDIISAALTLE